MPLGLHYDGRAFTPAIETIEIKDDRLRGSWGGRVYRILLKGVAAGRTGTIEVRIEQGEAMDFKIERKTCRAADGVELVYSAAGRASRPSSSSTADWPTAASTTASSRPSPPVTG